VGIVNIISLLKNKKTAVCTNHSYKTAGKKFMCRKRSIEQQD